MSLADRRLAWQQPLQSKGNSRYVYSVAEMSDALVSLQPGYGKAIILAADLIVDKSFILGPSNNGIRITSLSRSVLTPSAAMNGKPLFKVGTDDTGASLGCEDIRIDSLAVRNDGSNAFSMLVQGFGTCESFELSDNVWTAGLLLSGLAAWNEAQVLRNKRKHSALVASTGGITMVGGGSGINIQGNAGAASSTLPVSVTVGFRSRLIGNAQLGNVVFDGGAGSKNTISSNTSVGTITTNASGGFNTIVGNTGTGAIAAAGSDQVGLNT